MLAPSSESRQQDDLLGEITSESRPARRAMPMCRHTTFSTDKSSTCIVANYRGFILIHLLESLAVQVARVLCHSDFTLLARGVAILRNPIDCSDRRGYSWRVALHDTAHCIQLDPFLLLPRISRPRGGARVFLEALHYEERGRSGRVCSSSMNIFYAHFAFSRIHVHIVFLILASQS